MNKVLITGSTGFVGQNLVSYLKEKNAIVRNISREELNNIDNSQLDECYAVVHLAGKAHDLRRVFDSKEYYDINFGITKKLYDAFLQSEASIFIFVSSVKAAADTVDGILTEDQPPSPSTHYGKSKQMAEEYIKGQPLPVGKTYFILRPCMIHGPGNKGNLNLLYQLVRKGIPYPLAGFVNKRSFLSIENLSFVINELISQPNISSGTFQVSDDEPLSTSQVVSILSASLNRPVRLWRISPQFIKLIASLGDKLHLPLTTERLNKLTESYVVSNDKIKIAINRSLPVSSVEGLKKTALSFQKH
jgi:nucleoside-diphosphate-sugar epimerase